MSLLLLQVLIDAVVHAVNEDYHEMAGDFIKLGFLAPGEPAGLSRMRPHAMHAACCLTLGVIARHVLVCFPAWKRLPSFV